MTENPPEPPRRPTVLYTVAWAVFALVGFVAIGVPAQLSQPAWGIWFSEIIVFAGLAVVGYQIIGLRPLRAMGIQRFDARAFGLGLVAGVLNYVAWVIPLGAAVEAIFPKEMRERFDQSLLFDQASSLEVAIIVAAVSIAAPLGEELIYRGFLQRGLEIHIRAPWAIGVTAAVFAISHQSPVTLVPLFELGALFGLLAWRAGSVWPAIAAHGASNLLASSIFFLASDTTGNESGVPWAVALGALLLGNAALFGFLRFAWDRLPVKEPMDFVEQPPRLPSAALFPWAIAGLVAIGLLLAVDRRGVQLNWLDAVKLRPSKELRAREDVKDLRAKARRGEVPLEEYEAKVKSLK